jgi:hypothetical protein
MQSWCLPGEGGGVGDLTGYTQLWTGSSEHLNSKNK